MKMCDCDDHLPYAHVYIVVHDAISGPRLLSDEIPSSTPRGVH